MLPDDNISMSVRHLDHVSLNQFNSRLAARGPNSKWNASETVHKKQ